METITIIATVFGAINTLITFLIFLVKPFREWIFGIRKRREARDIENLSQMESMKCLIRNEITHFYYEKRIEKSLFQYEYENLLFLYNRYKELGGNSFVDKMWTEINTWNVLQ